MAGTDPLITSTISGDLIIDVKRAFHRSHLAKDVRRIGINAYTDRAYTTYVGAVAAVEAFINESFLGWQAKSQFKESALWQLNEPALERMDLLLKMVLIPQLLFAKTFDRSKQPYQDFALLVQVRNDIVHFKMKMQAPKYVHELSQRKIALVKTVDEAVPWPMKLSSTEGIRWAHNTACAVVQTLVEFTPEESRPFLVGGAQNFLSIDDREADIIARAGKESP